MLVHRENLHKHETKPVSSRHTNTKPYGSEHVRMIAIIETIQTTIQRSIRFLTKPCSFLRIIHYKTTQKKEVVDQQFILPFTVGTMATTVNVLKRVQNTKDLFFFFFNPKLLPST